jgi:hypothetical protein
MWSEFFGYPVRKGRGRIKMNENHEKELSITDIFDKSTGELKFSTFSSALLIDIVYKLVKNTTGSSAEFMLEGTVSDGERNWTYIMPKDKYIIDSLLQISADQKKQLTFRYQVAQMPDGTVGYAEKSLENGMSRAVRRHPGLDKIFSDIASYEYEASLQGTHLSGGGQVSDTEG